MMQKISMLILFHCLPCFSHVKDCKFDKKAFQLFIKSVYHRDVLAKQDSIHFIKFDSETDRSCFVEQVHWGEKRLLLKESPLLSELHFLRILSVSHETNQRIVIEFTARNPRRYWGTITLGCDTDSNPIFLDARIIETLATSH